jgi:hypothetical protein
MAVTSLDCSSGDHCVYTEDNVQSQFDLEPGVGLGAHNIGTLSRATAAQLGYRSSHSRNGQGSSPMTGAGVAQMRRLAAHPSLITVLPNSCVDPFFKPPIRLTDQGREAVHHSKCPC